jgi:uracil-DNA glycosylase family 4
MPSLNIIRKPDEFCKPCQLYQTCNTPIMNGEGSEHPDILFIGEAPGADEDEQGFPWAGRAGVILREAIEEVGIDPKRCRFSNAVRCRPPENKLPASAISHCRPHILREIRAVQPKVIVLLGATPLKSILNRQGVMKLHGETIVGPWKIVISFHPAWYLRNETPENYKKFLAALKLAKHLAYPRKSESREKFEKIVVQDEKTLKEVVDTVKKSKYPATDVEGSTLSPYAKHRKPELGCVGFSWGDRIGAYLPISSRVGLGKCLSAEAYLEAMKELWEDPDIDWLAHYGKYDYCYAGVLHNIWLGGKRGFYYADTELMAYCLDEKRGGKSLKDQAAFIGMLDYDQPKRQYALEHPEANDKAGGNILLIPWDILSDYNIKDCIACRRLFFHLRPKLKEQKLWDRPFKFPVMYHQFTAAIQEINGVKLDLERNKKLRKEYKHLIKEEDNKLANFGEMKKLQRWQDNNLLEELMERVASYKRPVPDPKKKVFELFEANKEPVNLGSPEVKRHLVFNILDYEPLWKTPSGKFDSASREVLEKLNAKRKNPVLTCIIERSELATLKSKCVDPIPSWEGTDGKTHTTYNVDGQVTGRVSSEDPNHENLPKRTPRAPGLREQFQASLDGIMEQDSKQVEMRLFADRAKDDVMIQEFADGKDPHKMGAMAGFEITPEQWDKLPPEEQKMKRTDAKSMVSFGVLYGRQAPALAEDFQKSERWARKFIDRYFAKYDDCLAYRLDREKYIKKEKIVYSHFFRPRRLPEVDSDIESQVAEAVRQGINAPIQGDASDITWCAGWRMIRWLQKYKMRSKYIITVHDAGYIDYHHKEIEDIIHQHHLFMTDRKWFEKMTGWYCEVPLDTDCFLGPSLGKMTELEHKGGGEFVVPSQFE